MEWEEEMRSTRLRLGRHDSEPKTMGIPHVIPTETSVTSEMECIPLKNSPQHDKMDIAGTR